MRAVPDIAVAFVRSKEGLKLTASNDVGGTPDVGYGHTGPEVKPGMVITKRLAELYLAEDLAIAAKRLNRVVKPEVVRDLTEHQYAALISFVFNVGCQSTWTIWKVLNARDFDRVPAQLLRFCYAGGKKVRGLVNRRTAEIELWATDEPGSIPDEPSSAVTRFADTPPAPAEKPKNTPLVTAAVSAVATVPVAVKAVSDAVEPFADKSPLVGQVVMALATIAALAAVLMVALSWLQRQQAKR